MVGNHATGKPMITLIGDNNEDLICVWSQYVGGSHQANGNVVCYHGGNTKGNNIPGFAHVLPCYQGNRSKVPCDNRRLR